MTSAVTTKVALGKGLQVGQPVAIGRQTGSRVLTLAAAAAPSGSADPVDRALQAAARRQFDKPAPAAMVEQVEPATPQRRYSVAHLSNVHYADGGQADRLLVYRGDLEAIMADVKTNREDKFTLRRNAQQVYRAGYRPLGVATAEGTPDGQYGKLTIAGFVPLRAVAAGAPGGMAAGVAQAVEYLRIPTWSVALRVMHWMNVALILILSLTGIYIVNPFFGEFPGGGGAGHLMGWVRLIHFVSAGVWVAMSFARVAMLFFSMNPLQRWPALWPFKSRRDLRNTWKVIKTYLFIDRHAAPVYVGHNPLQQAAYTGVYLMAVLQVILGFALYAQFHLTSAFWRFMAWPANFLSIPDLRLWHTMIMFLFWAFLILHLYLAVRADSLERHGGLSSMINGGIWLKKGTVTADDPRTYDAK